MQTIKMSLRQLPTRPLQLKARAVSWKSNSNFYSQRISNSQSSLTEMVDKYSNWMKLTIIFLIYWSFNVSWHVWMITECFQNKICRSNLLWHRWSQSLSLQFPFVELPRCSFVWDVWTVEILSKGHTWTWKLKVEGKHWIRNGNLKRDKDTRMKPIFLYLILVVAPFARIIIDNLTSFALQVWKLQ